MGLKVTGLRETSGMIQRIEETAKRRVRKKMIEKAGEVRDLAKKMAPRDEANLEEAIKVRGDQDGVVRDAAGRFTKIEIEIYVDERMTVPGRPDKTVGDYAYEMHEHLAPYGPLQLGEESLRKQAGNSGVIVGGKFMERAGAEVEKSIEKSINEALDNLF